MSSAEPASPKKCAFVIWDATTPGLETVLADVVEDPPPGWRVRVAALTATHEHIWEGENGVKAGIEAADLVVAYGDLANINVGFEIGYALGRGKPLRLASSQGLKPPWTEFDPFKSIAVPECRRGRDLADAIASPSRGAVTTPAARPATAGRHLVVGTRDGAGDSAFGAIEKSLAKHPSLSVRPDTTPWNLHDLSEPLGTAETVVLVLAPPKKTEARDGFENASLAILAGYARASGRHLLVLRHADFGRKLADIEWKSSEWSRKDQVVTALEASLAPNPIVAAEAEDILLVYRRWLGSARSRIRPRVPFFDQLLERATGEVYVELDILEGAPKDLQRGRGERLLSLRHRTLRELLELPPDEDSAGIEAGPGAAFRPGPEGGTGSGDAPSEKRPAASPAKSSRPDSAAPDPSRSPLPPLVTGRWHLLGDPGAGKSTACRHLCLALAKVETAPLPLFVPLPAWAAASTDPIGLVVRDFGATHGDHAAARLEQALRAAMADPARPFWFLFDSFDEVDPGLATGLLERLDAFIARLSPTARVLVTSRRTGAPFLGPRFRRASLQPLSESARRELLDGWLGPVRAAEVFAELRARPSLFGVVSNPLMLTLVAGIVREAEAGAPTPRTRGEIYERAITTLLKRGLAVEASGVRAPKTARAFLEPLSLRLQELEKPTWSEDEVAEALRRLRHDPATVEALAARSFSFEDLDRTYGNDEAFLEEVSTRSGLLGPLDGPGLPWSYLHRSLQEYLSACALAGLRAGAIAPRVATIAREPEKIPFWAETFGHYCTRSSSESALRETFGALVKANDGGSSRADLALRTLPSIEGVSPGLALELLRSCGGWNGDDLLAVFRSLAAQGHAAPRLTELLWPEIGPKASTKALAWIYYALDGSGMIKDPREFRLRFFAACRRDLPSEKDLPVLASIPSGRFLMGSPDDEEDRSSDEGPRHKVEISAFRLATTPVTVGDYAQFDSRAVRGAAGASQDLPVVSVSWWEAWLYCRWLHPEARLPTEAEWEYACRAGTTTGFWSGDSEADLTAVGWFVSNSKNRRHRVAEKDRPNLFGLHDMHGNVREWVGDWYAPYPEGADIRRDPRGPESGSDRAIRGGSFRDYAWGCRSTYRNWSLPGSRWLHLGFRVALPPPSR